ncbi:MAG: M20 family peptidase, partial [Mesorhizobium sp.]
MPTQSAETIGLLQDLIKIESINPSLSPQGSGEQGVAKFLEGFCKERNLAYG